MSLPAQLDHIDAALDPSSLDDLAAAAGIDADWFRRRAATSLSEARDAVRWIGDGVASIRVLEVGAGLGLLSAALAAEGAVVTAIEPSGLGFADHHRAAEALRSALGAEYTLLDLTVEQLAATGPDPFDLIVSVNVIEHVDDLASLLTTMHGLLADGGVMRHSCPNYRVPYEPHFGVPLIPSRPAMTARLLPGRISSSTLWSSLNFVTAPDIERYGSAAGAEVTFWPGQTGRAIRRLADDEHLRARHGVLAAMAPLLTCLRIDRALDRIPPRWMTPMIFEWRARSGGGGDRLDSR